MESFLYNFNLFISPPLLCSDIFHVSPFPFPPSLHMGTCEFSKTDESLINLVFCRSFCSTVLRASSSSCRSSRWRLLRRRSRSFPEAAQVQRLVIYEELKMSLQGRYVCRKRVSHNWRHWGEKIQIFTFVSVTNIQSKIKGSFTTCCRQLMWRPFVLVAGLVVFLLQTNCSRVQIESSRDHLFVCFLPPQSAIVFIFVQMSQAKGATLPCLVTSPIDPGGKAT